jgi:hypothetical protein
MKKRRYEAGMRRRKGGSRREKRETDETEN